MIDERCQGREEQLWRLDPFIYGTLFSSCVKKAGCKRRYKPLRNPLNLQLDIGSLGAFVHLHARDQHFFFFLDFRVGHIVPCYMVLLGYVNENYKPPRVRGE